MWASSLKILKPFLGNIQRFSLKLFEASDGISEPGGLVDWKVLLKELLLELLPGSD